MAAEEEAALEDEEDEENEEDRRYSTVTTITTISTATSVRSMAVMGESGEAEEDGVTEGRKWRGGREGGGDESLAERLRTAELSTRSVRRCDVGGYPIG